MVDLKETIRGLHPSYFGVVMATGIVSVAAHLTGHRWIASGLLWPNVAAYAVLWGLYLARLAAFPGRVFADLTDHRRGVGYFTAVAGTCVLGSQLVLVRGDLGAARLLWYLGVALWFALFYGVFTCLTVTTKKPTLVDGLDGGWLLPVVATQSVAVLGTLLAGSDPGDRDGVLFFALTLWLAGGMLYVWIVGLIVYRSLFLPVTPAQLTPPYWIDMGAMAISTLAGAGLVAAAPHSAALGDLLPFLKGLTLLFWSTATLWIPLLVILGVWRHAYEGFPVTYDPGDWGAVFPLGMYAAGTARMAEALGLPLLQAVPRFFLYAALAAWGLTAFGLARSAWRPAPPSARQGEERA